MTVPPTTAADTSAPAKKILVARFGSSLGAKTALEQLKNGGVRLGNSALIEREADGKISFNETQDWGVGKSALVGAIAAAVLPGIGVVLGAVAGGLAAFLIDAGFPDSLLQQLGSGLEIGTSMLVTLVQDADMSRAEQLIVQAGGTVLGSGTDGDLASALERIRPTGGAGTM